MIRRPLPPPPRQPGSPAGFPRWRLGELVLGLDPTRPTSELLAVLRERRRRYLKSLREATS